jgi:sugar phosphate permease
MWFGQILMLSLGVNFYLGSWYKRNELGLRAALFLSAAALAGSFGGLLAAALSTLNGVSGLPGWAWIFLIEGIVTVCVGFFCWWMVFDWPDTAGFLTPDERLRLCWRLTNDKQASTAEDYDKRHIYAALRDWKTWLFSIMFIGCCLPLYSFSLFLPTILRGMGYTGTHAQLLSVPPYASAAAATVLVGWLADRTRVRGYFNVAVSAIGAVGFAMLIASADPHIQYAGTFLGAIGIYPAIPNTLAWVSNNTEGVYKRGVVIGIVVGTGNLSGIVSSNIFLLSDSPRFYIGKGVVLATMLCFLQFGSIAMHVLLRRENQKRLEGQRDSMHEAMTSDEIWAAGDKRPDFIYTL